MATYVYSDAYLSFAGTVISDHVKSLALTTGVETGDKTAMGDTTRVSKGGMLTWGLSIEFHGDFAAAELDALISGLTASEAAIEVRPTSGAASPTNPKWTGTGLVSDYTPFTGSVGDTPASASVTLVAASLLVRAES